MKQFEEFSEICRNAIEHFRKNIDPSLLKAMKDSNLHPIYLTQVWQLCRGYFLALGVSRAESFEAANFCETHNFWLK
jgi:hypothetical protein